MIKESFEISMSDTPQEEVNVIMPGTHLRKIREARHLSIDEIAKRTHLSSERIIQIEQDNYSLMGAPAFAKGYLRSYASQLGLTKEDILAILKIFDDLDLGNNIQHNKPDLIHEKIEQSNYKPTHWIGYLVIILLLGVLLYLWYGHFNNINKTSNAEKTPETVEAATPAPEKFSSVVSPLPTHTPSTSPAQSSPEDTQANLLNLYPSNLPKTIELPPSTTNTKATTKTKEKATMDQEE